MSVILCKSLCVFLAPSSTFQHPVRLVINSTISTNEGRVEILYNQTWGTVCDDYWGYNDAKVNIRDYYDVSLSFSLLSFLKVVCRMLGFKDAVRAYSYATFGQGKGRIWLDNVRCVGTETELGDCPHLSWGTHNCQHYEDAGVACTSK